LGNRDVSSKRDIDPRERVMRVQKNDLYHIARTTSGSVSFGSRGLGRIRSSHCLESDCWFTGSDSEQRHDDDNDSEALAPSITRTWSHLATMEMVLRRALPLLAAAY
jgi:hypothetical protein